MYDLDLEEKETLMEFVISGLIFVLAVITYGLLIRKKLYSEIEKVEAWKIEIMNRPVTDEIAEVKKLNMTGQTEEKFDNWRQTWDEIITNKLPEIEEKLFDAEEAADRYRFKKAKEIIARMTNVLEIVEKEINIILSDLKELVGSEEKNRVEIEEQKFTLKQLRKTILANRHDFGKAEVRLDIELDRIEAMFDSFYENTEGGNYIKAREIVLAIEHELNHLSQKIEDIPILLSECIHDIPAQLGEIGNGYHEMIEQGYMLDDLKINEELDKIEQKRAEYLLQVEKAENINEVKLELTDTKERIEQLYSVLENEVFAKHQIVSDTPETEKELETLKITFQDTKQEVEYVQFSYQLTDKDLSQQKEIEKGINLALKKYDDLKRKLIENSAPSSKLQKDLNKIKENIEEIKEAHEEFGLMLKALRSDETAAREKVVQIRKQLIEARRLIQKSNLPGVPEFYLQEFETAEDALLNVKLKLEEKPLNINAVNNSLNDGMESAEKVYEQTVDMIEKANLTEKVIQYGNRYRTQYPFIAVKLIEAEQAFRQYQYDDALEIAATAIEEVEPGGMQRLNDLLEVAHH